MSNTRPTTITINVDHDLSDRFHDLKDAAMHRQDKSQLDNDEFLALLLEVYRHHLHLSPELGE